jgi:hypothetical protein
MRVTSIVLAGSALVVCGSAPGQQSIFGLDARSGAILWRHAYANVGLRSAKSAVLVGDESSARLPARAALLQALASSDGRLYVDMVSVSEPADGTTRLERYIEALDAATGAPLWRQEIGEQGQSSVGSQSLALSTGGSLIAHQDRVAGGATKLTIYATTDGALVGSLTYRGGFRSITDEGVVRVLEVDAGIARLHVLRVNSAARESARGAPAHNKSAVIPFIRVFYQGRDGRNASVEARVLDPDTGALRWLWQSPPNLAALLRLWGLRAPGAFAASIYRQLREAGTRFWVWAPRELRAGQWRHPAALPHVKMDVVGDMVYVSGRLGMFALRARDGALLWAGLPNREVELGLPSPVLVATP